jgi:hypothetical protein
VIKINIQNIKDKEMDRKDFLKYSGLVLLSVVGFKGIAGILTHPEKHLGRSSNSGRGFGGGKYGV